MMNIKRTAEDAAAGEDPDELYLAENVFWVPKEARWSHLQANAKQPSIGKLIARGDGRDRGGESRPERRPAQGL
jgi:type I restriction-modification system DNA methylase subunit